MKLWAKRLGMGVLILAGLILYLMHAKTLLHLPHLYPNIDRIHRSNLIFFGLTVLTLAFAWIAASYLLLNAEEKPLHLLLPSLAFFILLGSSSLCMTQAVADIPCSYTRSLEVCKEEFDPQAFCIQEGSLYSELSKGKVSAYSRYEKDGTLSESVTCSYDRDNFTAESNRIAALGLHFFLPPQSPAAQETVCYYSTQGNKLFQLLVVPKAKTVTYSRFINAEALPSFVSHPVEDVSVSTQGTLP